jgi:metal-responsive CopG/Arc/MetJ family transcriptional regulator
MMKTYTDLQFMSDSERISVVLPSETKKALDKLCEVERRSISNFVYLLIQDAIDKAKTEGKIE